MKDKKDNNQNTEPSLAQWTELYTLAKEIRKLEPWGFLFDSDLISIMLPEHEPIFCSIMGHNDECYAIGIYSGYESINTFYRLAETAADDVLFSTGFEQKCLLCNFGDREEITPKDREILKALDLRFRGRNEWIYFRTADPGYLPWYINAKQADLIVLALQQIIAALKDLDELNLEPNYSANETLMRRYSPEDEQWVTVVEKLPLIPVISAKLIVDDELMMARIKKQKRNSTQLEFDFPFMLTPVQENKDDRPFLPRLVLLVDKNSGFIIDQSIEDNSNQLETVVLNMLTEYIRQFGRPISISVRNEYTAGYLEDFCLKAAIKLHDDAGVPAIDAFMTEMLDFF